MRDERGRKPFAPSAEQVAQDSASPTATHSHHQEVARRPPTSGASLSPSPSLTAPAAERPSESREVASYAVAESRVGTWETVGEIVGCFGLDVLLQEKELRLAAGVAVAYLRGTVG